MKDWIISINQDLTAITIELDSIQFAFTGGCVDFGVKFELLYNVDSGERKQWFDPWDKSGDLNLLWLLINTSAECIVLSQDLLSLNFEGGTRIKCFNTNTVPEQVRVWGFESEKDREKYPDGEFATNYPNDYLNRFKKNVPDLDVKELTSGKKGIVIR